MLSAGRAIVWKLDAGAEMSVFAACSHDQADDAARDHAVFLGALGGDDRR
jgi:hypothetical protein